MKKTLLSTLLVGSTLAFCGAQAQQPPKATQPQPPVVVTHQSEVIRCVAVGNKTTAKPNTAPAATPTNEPKSKLLLKAANDGIIIPNKKD